MLFRTILLSASTLLSACAMATTSAYIPSSNHTAKHLDYVAKESVQVGEFGSRFEDNGEIQCRLVASVKTPNGMSYKDYIREAYIKELKAAGLYSDKGEHVLKGNVDLVTIDSTFDGHWLISVTLYNDQGASVSITHKEPFPTDFAGETSCDIAASRFMPAVQKLVQESFKNPEFRALLQ